MSIKQLSQNNFIITISNIEFDLGRGSDLEDWNVSIKSNSKHLYSGKMLNSHYLDVDEVVLYYMMLVEQLEQ